MLKGRDCVRHLGIDGRIVLKLEIRYWVVDWI
jgi:hypothetical protein